MNSNRKEIMARLTRELEKRNGAAGFVVVGQAQGFTPVDSGRLRSSLTHDSDESGVVIGTNVKYSYFVEGGTRYQAAQPYLVPGLMVSKETLARIYGQEIEV